MKKHFFTVLLAFTAISVNAQLKLSTKDVDNLVSLGELYSHNNMCRGEAFIKSANALRTPILSNVIDGLIENGKGDSILLEKRFMGRPTNDELTLWYVIREIHYNRIDTTKKPAPDMEVAQKVLSSNINEKWLVDNYYYMIDDGIAMLFNEADLSNHNFDLDNLGFKNDVEKDIFFFNMMNVLAHGRFRVLQYLKKQDKLLAMSHKLPMFNGKQYYYYTNLDIPDSDWVGYDKAEPYKQTQIGNLLENLLIQFSTVVSTGDKIAAREIYFNSILHKPLYFKYSELKETLQSIYDQAKQ